MWQKVVKVAWEGGKCIKGLTTEEGGWIGVQGKGFKEGAEDGLLQPAPDTGLKRTGAG